MDLDRTHLDASTERGAGEPRPGSVQPASERPTTPAPPCEVVTTDDDDPYARVLRGTLRPPVA